jgi:alpha-L-fucosidase 2
MLGNGRLGMIVPGGVADENIVLNESSLWTGNSNPSGGYDISISGDFGGYQLFGNLLLNLPNQTTYTGYTRTLDLNLGTATVTYMSGGIAYTRTLFCSAPDQVAVIQLTANTAAAYTGSIQLVDGHATGTISTPGGLMFSGVLPNSELYEAQLQIANRGAHWSTGGALLILPIATA